MKRGAASLTVASMSAETPDNAGIVAELSTLHDISSLGGARSHEELGRLALEKALRLFGVHRFGLWSGPPDDRRALATAGVSGEAPARSRSREIADNVFILGLGREGALGFLFMEKAAPLSLRERRVYDIFARRLEECLVALRREEEREGALADLRRSESEFRQLFEGSLDAVFLGRPDGSIIAVNEAWLKLFGYARDDLKTLNAIEFYVHPEERDEFIRRMHEQGYVDDEVLYRRKDGSTFLCQRAQVASRDGSGQVISYQGIMRDVTESRQTGEALRQSEAKFRTLFEQSLDAIWSLKPDGTDHEVNQAWLDMFGYSREELPGLNAVDLYADPADREEFLRKVSETGFVRDEVRFKRKDGTAFDVERTVVALKDATGTVIRFQGVSRDVTARKEAEHALRESEERFRLVFELSRDPMFIAELDGTQVEVNQAWLDLFGYSRDDVPHVSAVDMYADPRERLPFLCRLAREGTVRDEALYKRSDGTLIRCERAIVALRDSSGAVTRLQGTVRDVTGQRLVEQALRESEERFRTLFEQSMEPVWFINFDGTGMTANQAHQDLCGYTQDELRKMNARDRYADPSDRAEFLRRIAVEGSVRDVARLKRKDGTIYVCERSVVALRDEAGRIVRLQGIERDITELTRAEQALRESEERFRTLFEQSMDPIWFVNFDGTGMTANQAHQELFGYTEDELRRMNVREMYADPDDRDEFLRRIDRDGSVQDVARLKRKDGTVFMCERSIVALRDEAGRVIRLQGIERDITERIRAEQALREGEAEFRTLFEQSRDAIYLVALDGVITNVNSAGVELFGYPRDELIGMRVTQLYADPAQRESVAKKALHEGGLTDFELQLRRKDGTVRDTLVSATVLRGADGSAREFQSLIRDVTEQKRDREHLERSHEELRRLAMHLDMVREEERTRVAWELHDEVSQTLAVIGLELETLVRSLPPDTSTRAHAALERAQTLMSGAVERLRRLYTDLRPGMLDDLGLAPTIEWQVGEFARRSGIRCRVERLDDTGVLNSNCSLALYRAFQEALDNVVRHSGATDVEVSVVHDGQWVTVRVADNGRGITEEQAQSPASLGLASVREKLRGCGGQLGVGRGANGGTVVEAAVPIS
jgi:PAS domain S-box-containing protein